MNFPGGPVSLPSELLASGKSGSVQVDAPEKPVVLSRMSDAALFRLGDELATLLETEVRDDVEAKLVEYIDLLVDQVSQEITRRAF